MTLPEPELTPLQQAALDRIHFFESELEKRGLRVRMAMEQEFEIIPSELHYKNRSIETVIKQYFPSLLSLSTEGNDPNNNFLEARFGTDHKCRKKPSEIAMDVAEFRFHADDIMKKHFKDHQNLRVNFEPLQTLSIRRHTNDRQAKGLHANVSVYDQMGNDLHDNAGFRRAHLERLLNLQYQAGLGFIQCKETLIRLAMDMTPKHIGGHENSDGKKTGNSVLERYRVHNHKGDVAYFRDRYLEDRLPSANADPFVIVALELAAIYDAVTQYPELKDQAIITRQHVENAWPHHPNPIKHDLDHPIEKGKGMKPWVDRFNAHENNLRPLLGGALYEGIRDT